MKGRLAEIYYDRKERINIKMNYNEDTLGYTQMTKIYDKMIHEINKRQEKLKMSLDEKIENDE